MNARFVDAIRRSGLSIYDPIEVGDLDLWIPTPQLGALLDHGLHGLSLTGLPLRTRSKVVKENVCRVLGYPIPASFRKTQPRFPGQLFDTYVQKSDNLQVWNEELAPTRRYVLIRVSASGEVAKVKAVTGDTLGELDTTGTLTQKYQARCVPGEKRTELLAAEDTVVLRPFVSSAVALKTVATPVSHPAAGQLLPIGTLLDRLTHVVGVSFGDTGRDQERNRGAALHRLVCKALETSPTIDLGLARPDSTDPIDVPKINGKQIRHCDVCYVIFCGHSDGRRVTLTHLFFTTGEAFFRRFPQFQGKVLNKKLQIPLPSDFFDR